MKDGQDILSVAIDRVLNNQLLLNAWLWHTGYIDPVSAPAETQKFTKLHVAAEQGLVSYVKYLIESGPVDIDLEYREGSTPLFGAAEAGKAEMVQLLIGNGAKPDRPNKYDGWYPLHAAARCNHWRVIRVLLEAGMDPLAEKTKEDPGRRCGNAPRTKGHTPLMVKFPSPFLPTRRDSLSRSQGKYRFMIDA
jgi:ankyrin repeat protein